jgi:hypothetical protein
MRGKRGRARERREKEHEKVVDIQQQQTKKNLAESNLE